jgi:hypothetical protein
MNDTPETDAALYPMNGVDIVWPEFSRKLERERDESRKSLDEMSKYLAQVTAGRDHAETELCKMIDFSKSALGERNEAREALREIWQSGDAFLPYIDEETTNRWRKAAGWKEAK